MTNATLNQHVINITILSLIMAFIDYFYLSAMGSFFNTIVTSIQGSPLKLKLLPTVIVYMFLVFQLYYFTIIGSNGKDFFKTILDAFLLGASTYGIYEYTNKAIFNKWTYAATLYDTVWGGVLFGTTTGVYRFIMG